MPTRRRIDTVAVAIRSASSLQHPMGIGDCVALPVHAARFIEMKIIEDGLADNGTVYGLLVRPTHVFGPGCKMQAGDPVQLGLGSPNNAEAELALLQAMRLQLLGRAKEVSQSIRIRVTALLGHYSECDSRMHHGTS